jgi:hypothetical protein
VRAENQGSIVAAGYRAASGKETRAFQRPANAQSKRRALVPYNVRAISRILFRLAKLRQFCVHKLRERTVAFWRNSTVDDRLCNGRLALIGYARD